MAMNITQIDNVDPQVVYGGVWTQHPNKEGFNNTISLTRRVGNTATLMFTGNSVAVYGQLGTNPPDAPAITKYEIDDGEPITFAPPSPPSDLKRLLFFQSRAYPYGTHKLVMTNMVDLDWIWLDYFEVTNISDGNSSQIPPTNPTFIVAGASSSNKPSPGVIVGATLGGLTVALLIMGAIVFLWRKKKQAKQETDDDSESSYNPFRRSATMRDVEQSYPYENRGSASNYTSLSPSPDSPDPTAYYSTFNTIPPSKMIMGQPHVQTEQPHTQLPPYS